MEKIKVAAGTYWVSIPEAALYILCGCPADSVKLLAKRGLTQIKEKNGVAFETGPNVILLSDLPVQNGRFSNLAEFPVLQMLYRQGMLIPGHPNNTGIKPMLVGIEEQIKSQSQYIYRGNYGLTSMEEMLKTGVSESKARELMRIKMQFAFGNIRKTEELLDLRVVDKDRVELRNGVFVTRHGVNQYEFSFRGETLSVDLNLQTEEQYECSYVLGFYQMKKEYFSVTHIGDGDGWDVNRPCTSSLLTFQGKLYLIDVGPNIDYSLTSMGVSVNEIEGIFHTHGHDDHFAGLTALVRSGHRLKYFTTPLVRVSVAKKLSALMDIPEDDFEAYFDIHDLRPDVWNNINGLEVKPVISPHPVETCVFTFRALWEDGYKTYAHLSDIASFGVLKKMVTSDSEKNGLSRANFDKVKKSYLFPADLKKIDIGGGMIHGDARDFSRDASGKIILSHTSKPLTTKEKEVGSSASFGVVDVLITSHQDYLYQSAFHFLRTYYEHVPNHELMFLLNCPILTCNPGSILTKRGAPCEHLFLMLTGVADSIEKEARSEELHTLSAGALIGELAALHEKPYLWTVRAQSHVNVIKISSKLYTEFVRRNQLYESIHQLYELRQFLQNTWLFGDMLSYPMQNKIAKAMERHSYAAGKTLPLTQKPGLYLIERGNAQLLADHRVIETITGEDFVGEDYVLFQELPKIKARATRKTSAFWIPTAVLLGAPIVRWKLLETYDRRHAELEAE